MDPHATGSIGHVPSRSTLFTKKWTKGRRNQLNVYLFMKTRIDNKHKYA